MDPKTHDYRDHTRCWGHDRGYKPLPGNRLDAYGWGLELEVGDYMLLTNGETDTRYQIDEIRYSPNPKDMWFAKLSFAPRTQTNPAPPPHKPQQPRRSTQTPPTL